MIMDILGGADIDNGVGGDAYASIPAKHLYDDKSGYSCQ
jgi:hypothetical protein